MTPMARVTQTNAVLEKATAPTGTAAPRRITSCLGNPFPAYYVMHTPLVSMYTTTLYAPYIYIMYPCKVMIGVLYCSVLYASV